ncbi:MAG: isoprenylcysteine carboxylmethyltransferase family protein [Verrucomicrobiae bacterium]|nr:isoprenylcysteine carboxylmethyltransferase family protein [Verrucomicrobiae bacterium]
MSRPPRRSGFWQRGGVWVLAQSVLMGLVVLAAELDRARPAGTILLPIRVAGGLLFAWGALVGMCGALILGGNRTIFPAPNHGSQLVRHGVYRWLRHPLYSSLMGLSLGWSCLRGSWAAAGASLLLVAFLRCKAAHEERLLRARFPDYDEYSRRTRRFLPGLW